MLKAILILLVLLVILGVGVILAVTGAVLPWFTVRSERSISPGETSVPNQVNLESLTAPVTLTPGNDQGIVYKGISFILKPALAKSAEVINDLIGPLKIK